MDPANDTNKPSSRPQQPSEASKMALQLLPNIGIADAVTKTPPLALSVAPMTARMYIGVAPHDLTPTDRRSKKLKTPHFSDGQLTEVAEYISILASALRLHEWTITLSAEPSDEDKVASVLIGRSQRRATMQIHADFFKPSNIDSSTDVHSWQRQSLTHELLHITINPILHTTESMAIVCLKDAAYDIFSASVDYQVELAVDHLADSISSLLPLPVWSFQDTQAVTP